MRVLRTIACAAGISLAFTAPLQAVAGEGRGGGAWILEPALGRLWKVHSAGRLETIALPASKEGPVSFSGGDARVSPDRRYVAASPFVDGEYGPRFWLADLERHTTRWITPPGLRRGDRPGFVQLRSWSCDSRQIVFEIDERDGDEAGADVTTGLFTYDVVSGAVEPVESPEDFVGMIEAAACSCSRPAAPVHGTSAG